MGGRYKAYPEYKDSGVVWLGEIPKHWEIAPLKYLAEFKGGGTPSKENLHFWNGDIPWVSPKDMKSQSISSTIDSVTELAVRQSSTNLLAEGALLLVVRSGILQHTIPVAINSVPVTLNQDMKALLFSCRMTSKFAMFFILGNQKSLLFEWCKQGATVESIEHEYLANSELPIPSLDEQQAIVDFLDHETAKVDTLIEKQQQLIQLLKEKRQAVISHAVTKGLNPNAKMRDSGVEWLGEIPRHWKLSPLKYLAEFRGGGTPSKDNLNFWNGDIPWVSPKDMKSQSISSTIDCVTEFAIRRSSTNLVKEGALLLVVRSGILQHTIPVAINAVPVTLNQDMKALLFSYGMTSKFAMFFILGNQRRLLFEWCKQGATVESIEHEHLANSELPIPDPNEQEAIVYFLDHETAKIDNLIENQQQIIQLLQERRTALISAAVTGKIDVRDWVPPTPDHRSEEAA